MPIKKTSASTFHDAGQGYTVTSSAVAQSIRNTDALAIWLYLQTKPSDWVIRKAEVKSHFELSDARYRNAIRYLKEAGLMKSDAIRDIETGCFGGSTLCCYSEPQVGTEDVNHRASGKPGRASPEPRPMLEARPG